MAKQVTALWVLLFAVAMYDGMNTNVQIRLNANVENATYFASLKF